MAIYHPKSIEDLSDLIKTGDPAIYLGSRTSTVIPESFLADKASQMDLIDLSGLPKSMEIRGEVLSVTGPVSWKEAKLFLEGEGFALKTSPTEELALILSGAATSCTGERAFMYGAFRDQVRSIQYLDHHGELRKLSKTPIKESPHAEGIEAELKAYQASYDRYEGFKNAPFPRLELEIDLAIGFEGQTGVITQLDLEIVKSKSLEYLMIELPRWEEDYQSHVKSYHFFQELKDIVLSCELIDSNCIKLLDPELGLSPNRDYIFLEIFQSGLDHIFSLLSEKAHWIDKECIFSLTRGRYQEIRMGVPRLISDYLSQNGLIKKGTDAQVSGENLADLFEVYKSLANKGIPYVLFGHFGDAHLHFNFLASQSSESEIESFLEGYYKTLVKLKASPFAEHGIGVIKKRFMKEFYSDIHLETFKKIKKKMDPKNQFFPKGFMNV